MLSQFLELQRRMLGAGFQQRKLLVRTVANILRQRRVYLSEARIGTVLHPVLERLHSTALFVVQSSLNGLVKAARREIGLDARIDGMRLPIKPHAQFFQLLRRERTDSAFDLFDRV
jgi:hypothetical protein